MNLSYLLRKGLSKFNNVDICSTFLLDLSHSVGIRVSHIFTPKHLLAPESVKNAKTDYSSRNEASFNAPYFCRRAEQKLVSFTNLWKYSVRRPPPVVAHNKKWKRMGHLPELCDPVKVRKVHNSKDSDLKK